MSRPKFIRLSGWGMVLAALAMTAAIFAEPHKIRESLYHIAGPPVTRAAFDRYVSYSEGISTTLALFGIALLTTGLIGLRLRYAGRAGEPGRDSLSVSILGGAVAFVGGLGTSIYEPAWIIFVLGLTVQFGALAVFGIRAIRERIMPRGNFFPFFSGIYFPLFIMAAAIYELYAGGSWLVLPDWLEIGLVTMTFASLAGLGFVLARDAVQAYGHFEQGPA